MQYHINFKFSAVFLQIQSVFNALEHLSHNQSAMIKRAVRDREVNLSVPIYLLSAAIKSLGRKEVDRSEIT